MHIVRSSTGPALFWNLYDKREGVQEKAQPSLRLQPPKHPVIIKQSPGLTINAHHLQKYVLWGAHAESLCEAFFGAELGKKNQSLWQGLPKKHIALLHNLSFANACLGYALKGYADPKSRPLTVAEIQKNPNSFINTVTSFRNIGSDLLIAVKRSRRWKRMQIALKDVDVNELSANQQKLYAAYERLRMDMDISYEDIDKERLGLVGRQSHDRVTWHDSQKILNRTAAGKLKFKSYDYV